MHTSLAARALLAVAVGAITVFAASDAGAVDNGKDGGDIAAVSSIAQFEGRSIDLKQGWGDAQACHVAEDLSITCFRTEKQMDDALGLKHVAGGDYPSAANGYASCGSSLRLYRNSYYSTPVLYLTTRWSWITLSWFGFDNVTSSYKVGACQSLFRSGSYGTGSTYPGWTGAYAKRSTMGWSWDNVLSSVYIY